ncbi:MAG: aldehyde dehydrogenase family protein, partial [Sulfitobacter sp.]
MSVPVLHPNLIDGNWVENADFSINGNPADQTDIIGHFARVDADQVASAIQAADAAAPAWADASPQVRSDLLEKVAQRVLEKSAELGCLLAREEGKSLVEATGEVIRAGQIFRFFAGEALRLTGDSIASVRAGVDVQVNREPVGVVGIITPWNFPMAIPAWKIAPALAFGNTVVFKPADLTPASAHALVKIIHDAGFPPGVMNLVMGRGSLIGDLLVENSKVSAITFTGSAPVGRGIAVRAAGQMKKVQLEMGGKNPMVIMEDADLDTAVAVTLNSAFFSTGQRCTAVSRIIVHEAIHDTFVELLSAGMRALIVGNPLD